MKVMILMVSDELHIKVKELALDNYTSMSEIVRKSILTSIDRNTFVKLPEKIRHLNREEWRDKIKIRDNYICQHCGLQMDKYIALAHHILSKKKGGKNVLENGITLCRDCHFKIHQKIKKGGREMTAGVFAQKNAKEQSRILLALQREAYSNPAKVEELAQLREIYWHGYNEVIKEIESREVGR